MAHVIFNTKGTPEIEALIAVWQQYIATMGDWQKIVKDITPKQTDCGPIYEPASPLDRPNESFAIADMRNVEVAEPHYHTGDETEIYFVLSGSGLTVIGGQELQIQAGDVIVTPPETAHFTIPKEDLVMIVINTPPFDAKNNIHVEEGKMEVGYDEEQYKRLVSDREKTGFSLAIILSLLGTLIVIGLLGLRLYTANNQPHTGGQTQTTPLATGNSQQVSGVSSPPPSNMVTDTFDFKEVTVRLTHDAGWQKTGPTLMKKTIAKRSFRFQIQVNNFAPADKIDNDYLKRKGYGGNLKTLTSFPGPHGDLFILKDGNQYAYLSSCPASSDGLGCSPQLSDKSSTIFIALNLDVPNAQYSVPLDLTQPEDQQALNDFIAISKTIQY